MTRSHNRGRSSFPMMAPGIMLYDWLKSNSERVRLLLLRKCKEFGLISVRIVKTAFSLPYA